jgi:hypothetical protein
MNKTGILLLAAMGTFAATQLKADTTLADFTFETSQPNGPGPFNAEVGLGSASASHAGTAAFSSPAGNGSSHSYSANVWAVGDFYQVQVSTLGFQSITLSYDQISSATGPGTFKLQWSTDGTTFNNFGSDYNVLVNAAPNAWSTTAANHITTSTFTDDLSSVTQLNNDATIFLRFVDDSTQSASQVNGGTLVLATAGTDRMDNIIVTGTAIPTNIVANVPEIPSECVNLLGLASFAGMALVARRKK